MLQEVYVEHINFSSSDDAKKLEKNIVNSFRLC